MEAHSGSGDSADDGMVAADQPGRSSHDVADFLAG
jgi:hypothetical protein